MKMSGLRKTWDEHVIIKKISQKFYEKLRTKLYKTYDKLMTSLQVSYTNVKFAASDVILETVCHWLKTFS